MSEDLKRYISDNFETALEKNYIQVFYQPVIRTISGKLCSFEALARWVDPVHGLICPDDFIPVLEREERIHELDSHIIREVCRRIRRCIDAEEIPIPVSFNLSRLDFKLCDVFQIVDDNAREYQVPHDALHVEITESVAAEQESVLYELIDRFHGAGYQVWMDDFGSGYSTLNVLKDYPFDELKLDMRFLSSFSQRSRQILTSLIQMAKEIGIHTLTEGVETEEQFRYLRDVGCEKVQGFYFGRPQPFRQALSSLREKGIAVETPGERKYYDDLGAVNVLSSIPFKKKENREQTPDARSLNSIPLAIAEIRSESFSILFFNHAFEENAMATGFISNLFREDLLRMPMPFSRVPARVYELVESCRGGGEGNIQFVSNEEYYELRCKCVARMHGAYSVLLQLNNLSQASLSARTSQLDEGLRQLYTLYDSIVMIDLERDLVTPLYIGTMSHLTAERGGIREIVRENADHLINREDREAYLRFFDMETIERRLDESGCGYVACYLRTRTRRGRFSWKLYTLLRLRPGRIVELVRDVHAEIDILFERQETREEIFTPEQLWKNLVGSDLVCLFWKDTERRFVGASSAFLDYYGFASENEVIGRTDEEMGWHVHPDAFMRDELKVIQEGVSIHNIPGRCMREGENREILASKAPFYNERGDICGLIGCFMDRELLGANDSRGRETVRRDQMTGLLNSRGIHEEAHAFKDEYYLRGTDFVRLQVAIDDLASINREYGFDFGDKAIATLGAQLKKAFGTTAAVGRVNGYQFVILRQIREGELAKVLGLVRKVCDEIREIDGVAITLYVSCGSALFSESEDLEEQSRKAEMLMLADHDEHASAENRLSRASEIFRMFDMLPIACAVYRLAVDRRGRIEDAVVFYVNHMLEERVGMQALDLIGRSTRELFPDLGPAWYELARRAGLEGETLQETRYYSGTGKRYYLTASPVIRRGYVCFTYQELDGCGGAE